MHNFRIFLIISTSLLIMLTSCQTEEPFDFEEALPNAQVLQDLVGVIDAAQGVYEDENPEDSKAFYPEAVDISQLADTSPAGLFSEYGPAVDGIVRCPDTGLFTNPSENENDLGYDFSVGTYAYFTLEDIGSSKYLVKLYMFQTLSPLVEYEYEEYTVNSDSWEVIEYQAWETYYYGGLVEERTVVDNVTTFVPDSYFDMPDDFSDSAYDYPVSISMPATGAADFSLYSTGVISFGKKLLKEKINLTEFYTEANGQSYSKAYSVLDLSVFCHSTRLAETVTMWQQDANQNKVMRFKSVGDFGIKDIWQTTLTGVVQTGTNIEGRNTYDGNWKTTKVLKQKKIFESNRELNLIETAVDSNVYEGAMSVQRNNKTFSYSVSMGPWGLYISKNSHKYLDMSDLKDLDDIEIDFDDNSHFKGQYRNGLFDGQYTHSNGNSCTIIVDGHMKHFSSGSSHYED